MNLKHDQRGSAAIIAIVFILVSFFVIYIGYSLFYTPTTTVVEAIDAADAENAAPRSIFDNVSLLLNNWPIVAFILVLIVGFAFIYRWDIRRGYD